MAVTVVARWSVPNLDLALVKKAKAMQIKLGAQDMRFSRIHTGPFTGEYMVATIYADMAAYGKASVATAANAGSQKLQAEIAKSGAVMHEREILIGLDV